MRAHCTSVCQSHCGIVATFKCATTRAARSNRGCRPNRSHTRQVALPADSVVNIVSQIQSVFQQIFQAIDFLHQNDVVHRNLSVVCPPSYSGYVLTLRTRLGQRVDFGLWCAGAEQLRAESQGLPGHCYQAQPRQERGRHALAVTNFHGSRSTSSRVVFVADDCLQHRWLPVIPPRRRWTSGQWA